MTVTTMLEKMARAFQDDLRAQRVLYEIDKAHPDHRRLMLFTGETADLHRALRAALEAIREPSEAVREAGMEVRRRDPHNMNPSPEWSTMIDAILAENPSRTKV
jgi:hypothetical protein